MNQYSQPNYPPPQVDGHITFRLDPATGRVKFMGEGPASAFQSLMLDRMPEPPPFEIPSVPRQPAIAPAPDDRLDRIETMIVRLAQRQHELTWDARDGIEARPEPRHIPPASPGREIVRYGGGPERIGPPPQPPQQPEPPPPDAVGNMGFALYDATFTAFVRNVLGVRSEGGTFAIAFALFLGALVLGIKVGIPAALNMISASPEVQELLAENKSPPRG